MSDDNILRQLTDAEIKAFLVQEIEVRLAPLAAEVKTLTTGLEQLLKLVEQQTAADAKQADDETKDRRAILMKMAEIERRLGIDPAEAELDPSYRN
jgi:hypothetical protein